MKVLMALMSVFILMSCSSHHRNPTSVDDTGAQKQDSMRDENNYDQQQHIRNQFPGRSY